MTPLLVLLLLGADPPPAKPSPPPSTPGPVSIAPPSTATPEQRALATELVQLVQSETTYQATLDRMTDQMIPSMEAQAKATGRALPDDFRKRFKAVLLEVLPYQELVEWSSGLYAERFTASELRELIAFYQTPLGRKISLFLPELMGEVGKKTAAMMPSRLPAALRRHGLGGPGQQQSPPLEQPLKKM